MPADEAVGALRARLEQYAADRDPAVVLHPAALADVLALGTALDGRLLDDPEAAAILGMFHWQRYLLLPEPDDREDLRSALAVFRELAVAQADLVPTEVWVYLVPQDEIPAGLRSVALGEQLLADQLRTGDPRVLDQAITTFRQGAEANSAEISTVTRLNLAVALYARYMSTGQIADIDGGIFLATSAISDPDATIRSAAVRMLAGLHTVRYQITGAIADLDLAITYGRNDDQGESPSERAGRLSNLGLALRSRFERAGDVGDLHESIDVHRQAVELRDADDPAYYRYLSNLGLALRIRFESQGDPADLDEAVEVTRRAVAVSPSNPELFRHFTNLGLALRQRYGRSGDRKDLEEAIQMGRAAVAYLPHGHPERAGALVNLGGSLLAGAVARPEAPMLAEAVEAFSHAIRSAEHVPALRALAATNLGRAAAMQGDWVLGAESFEIAISAIDLIVRHGDRGDSEFHLARFAGVASDAAACALHAGDAGRAAELWEYGHGVLIRQALDLRNEAETALIDVAPDLATRFTALREAAAGTRRSVRHREWSEVVSRIRELPGFENFLRPAQAQELLAAASEGPVVLLNVSVYRSDALVLTTNGIKVIPLPELSPDLVRERYAAFARGIHMPHNPEIAELLGWLWDAVAEPVLDSLEADCHSGTGPSRLWWCLSGPLAFLPLHGAGRHDGDRRTVLDRVVSSYTPTVRALVNARLQDTVMPPVPRMLAVGIGNLAGVPGLSAALQEATELARHFPAGEVLTDAEATADAVLRALPDSAVVHFACHGRFDPVDPSASGLLLNDRMLTVRDLADVHVPNAHLAYLSACETAATGELLADESVTLASAFLLTGYRNVVANLWPIADRMAQLIASRFYRNLAVGFDPALALHAALQATRDHHPTASFEWASTIHVGP